MPGRGWAVREDAGSVSPIVPYLGQERSVSPIVPWPGAGAGRDRLPGAVFCCGCPSRGELSPICGDFFPLLFAAGSAHGGAPQFRITR